MLPAHWQLGDHRIVAPVKKTPGCVLGKHNPGPVCHAPSCIIQPSDQRAANGQPYYVFRYIHPYPACATWVLEKAGWLLWIFVSQRLPIEPLDAPMRDWPDPFLHCCARAASSRTLAAALPIMPSNRARVRTRSRRPSGWYGPDRPHRMLHLVNEPSPEHAWACRAMEGHEF
jgi:hypothetical protein